METLEYKFLYKFIKELDEIMLDKNLDQDEKLNKIILARINLTAGMATKEVTYNG